MHALLILIALFAVTPSDMPTVVPATHLLAFHGQGCKPCLEMRPVLRRLEKDGVNVVRVDIDAGHDAKVFMVRAVPTFISIRDNREVGRIVGKTTLDKLRKLLGREPTQVLPEPKPEKKKPERSVLRRKR